MADSIAADTTVEALSMEGAACCAAKPLCTLTGNTLHGVRFLNLKSVVVGNENLATQGLLQALSTLHTGVLSRDERDKDQGKERNDDGEPHDSDCILPINHTLFVP